MIQKILYVGISGGMELLQFSYFSRKNGAVIGIDPVEKIIDACATNIKEAELENSWFKGELINLKNGDALNCPLRMNRLMQPHKIDYII